MPSSRAKRGPSDRPVHRKRPAGRNDAARTAVVAGASGLVGTALLHRLLRQPEYENIVALTRRPLNVEPRVLQVPARFDDLATVLDPLTEAGSVDAFCCLGTTMKSAGSEAAFRRVDYEYVVAFGEWAKTRRAHRLIVVSATGADATSSVRYNRIKGETEDALRALSVPLVVLRPSLLDGARVERRVGEALALALTRPLRALIPATVRPVAVDDVAQSMLDAALSPQLVPVVNSAAMQEAAARADRLLAER